jgi:hypothetical protein
MSNKNQAVGGLFFHRVDQESVIKFQSYWIQTTAKEQGKAHFDKRLGRKGRWVWDCTGGFPDGSITGIFELPKMEE